MLYKSLLKIIIRYFLEKFYPSIENFCSVFFIKPISIALIDTPCYTVAKFCETETLPQIDVETLDSRRKQEQK